FAFSGFLNCCLRKRPSLRLGVLYRLSNGLLLRHRLPRAPSGLECRCIEMRTSFSDMSVHVLAVHAVGWEQAIGGPKQPPRSLCSPLGRCHLGQSSKRLDDADPLLHRLQVPPQAQALPVEHLCLLLVSPTMEPDIPYVDQEQHERPPILGPLHEWLELLIQESRHLLVALG